MWKTPLDHEYMNLGDADPFSDYFIPYVADINYALSSILLHVSQLGTIVLDGALYQENLDILTNLPFTTLHTLKLRMTAAHPCVRRYPDQGFADRSQLALDWTNLRRLEYLRTVEIGQLRGGEGSSLAIAVSLLENLEKLVVVAGRACVGEVSLRPSPLNSSLDALFPNVQISKRLGPNTRVCLPESLQWLALIDYYSPSYMVRNCDSRLVTPCSLPLLRDLYVLRH